MTCRRPRLHDCSGKPGIVDVRRYFPGEPKAGCPTPWENSPNRVGASLDLLDSPDIPALR